MSDQGEQFVSPDEGEDVSSGEGADERPEDGSDDRKGDRPAVRADASVTGNAAAMVGLEARRRASQG